MARTIHTHRMVWREFQSIEYHSGTSGRWRVYERRWTTGPTPQMTLPLLSGLDNRARRVTDDSNSGTRSLGTLLTRISATKSTHTRTTQGWAREAHIVTIDTDQGQAGAKVRIGKASNGWSHRSAWAGAGTVLGLEGVPAGTRQRRLTPAAGDLPMSAALICDEDGLYDPTDFSDRLLLGLKGTMSEAELHFIRARLVGGQLRSLRLI